MIRPSLGKPHTNVSKIFLINKKRQLTRVNAEYLYTWEWSDDPDPEADHVSDGGDGDGDGSILKRRGHPVSNLKRIKKSWLRPRVCGSDVCPKKDLFKTLVTLLRWSLMEHYRYHYS